VREQQLQGLGLARDVGGGRCSGRGCRSRRRTGPGPSRSPRAPAPAAACSPCRSWAGAGVISEPSLVAAIPRNSMPGHDELRQARDGRLGARRGAAEPIVKPRRRRRDHVLRHRRRLQRRRRARSLTGRLLRKLFGMREEYVLATKVYMPTMPGENGPRPVPQAHHGRDRRLAARLGSTTSTSTRSTAGTRTPIEETMEALHDVVRRARRATSAPAACSPGSSPRRRGGRAHGWTSFVSMQNHYNLIYREEEREMIPQCIDQGVG
jgi:hypothetical protein